MTATEQAGQAETRAQEKAREAAERAEWDRLSKIYFAHMNAVAPDQFHCFCGSLDDLRQAVARLDREALSRTGRTTGSSSSRGAPANRASRGAVSTVGGVGAVEQGDQNRQRREQLTQWHTADRSVERSSVDVDAD